MAEVMGQRSGVVAIVGELVARRMPEHVPVHWERYPRCSASSLTPQEPNVVTVVPASVTNT
jgi:hypothetical protein